MQAHGLTHNRLRSWYVANWRYLRPDRLQNAALDVIQNGGVLNHRQVLSLTLELLVGVIPRPSERAHGHLLLLLHLRHLTGGWRGALVSQLDV